MIYDQTCAAEKRRRRKRNLYPDPAKRAFINHHVCEGCGDCSVQSNCLSVVPRQTELGRKRKIDQSSCNKDYSCVNGFCPSFVTIEGGQLRKSRGMDTGSVLTGKLTDIPEPVLPQLAGSYDVLVGGVGGTGVVTVGQLITMAAHLEARGTSVLDFTGFAQKGGTVLSYVRMAPSPDKLNQVRISNGQADAVIACDLVVASSQKALSVLRPNHTRVVANEAELPTADYVLFRDADMQADKRLDLICNAVGDHNFARLDANGIAESLMGDTVFSNVMMLGFAWQRGLLPLSQAALMKAIELNGVAVDRNKEAFGWGRVAAVDVKAITDLLNTGETKVEEVKAEPSLDELISTRHKHLVSYQNRRWANRYTNAVKQVREAEEKLGETNQLLTRAVAQHLYRFMAFKDEYEVARLFAETDFMKEVNNTFEGDFKIHFHLAPPIMNRGTDAQGRPKKRQFGPWMFRAFKLLAKFRVLRGTAIDPFSYSADRKMDRAQLKDYQRLVERIVSELETSNYDTFLQLAELASEIRGYGPVREQAAEAVQEKQEQLTKALDTGRPTLIRTQQADSKEADHV
ncbi:MAG: DUF6537 domain-containing protein [Marinobacter sp.]